MILLTLTAVAALQGEPQAQASASAPTSAAAAKKHCAYEDVPGSNFQRRVCRTDAEEQQHKQDLSTQMSAGTTITRGPRS